MITPEDILVESFSTPSRNLRIAIVTETFPPEVNGVAMTLGRLVNGLLQRGHSVQLVRPRQPLEGKLTTPEGLDEVLCRGIQIPAYKDLRFGLPLKNRLSKMWLNNRPDIVHVVTEGPLGWSAVAAARKLHLPVTSSFHTNFHSYSNHYGLGLLKTPIESYLRKLHNKTDATLVPTRALVHELQQRGFKNVSLLSRGIDTSLFSPTKRSLVLRAKWRAAPDDLVLMFVSRLAKEKNVGLAIAAYRAIKEKLPQTRMVFVGDGPMRKQLEETCPDAIFTGVKKGEELAAHYASADIFLFPSLTETFGNVITEAMASGLAVLSYDKAAAKELIEHGKNGMVVPPGDELKFVNTAASLALDTPGIQRIRQAAAPSIAHLGWDAIHNSFAQTLLRTVEHHEMANPGFIKVMQPAISQPSA